MKSCIVFLLLLLITAALFACSPTDRFSAGKPISREELDAIAADLLETEADTADEILSEQETVIEQTTESEPAESTDSEVVYWTKNGSVYHTNPDCYHIRNASDVRKGSVAEAGKSKLCSTCQKTQNP